MPRDRNGCLLQKWSPKQIGKRLREDHIDDAEMRVSHETIYFAKSVQSIAERHRITEVRYFGDLDLSGIRITTMIHSPANIWFCR